MIREKIYFNFVVFVTDLQRPLEAAVQELEKNLNIEVIDMQVINQSPQGNGYVTQTLIKYYKNT